MFGQTKERAPQPTADEELAGRVAWDYQRVSTEGMLMRVVDDKMMELGARGWEGYASTTDSRGNVHLFLKRPKAI